MRLSYQHANPGAGNESTILRFRDRGGRDGRSTTVLVDAGRDVDLERALDDAERLDAVLLTHAHIDHYWSLGRVASDGGTVDDLPVYATPSTADALDLAMPEATKDAGIPAPDAALDALEPIESWTPLGQDDGEPAVECRPVPAGHAPGAGGFLLRFRPGSDVGPLPPREEHLLVTGDFTARAACGTPGLDPELPPNVGAVLCNVSTRPDYEARLNEALEAALEHALAGSPTLVTASALTGVHFAALCARIASELGRSLPVRVVGQTAKLWRTFDLDLQEAGRDGGEDPPRDAGDGSPRDSDVDRPRDETDDSPRDSGGDPPRDRAGSTGSDRVAVVPEFDRPETVLDPGTLTVAGPEAPTTGSAGRLVDALSSDGSAALVQLLGGASDPYEGFPGTSRAVDLVNHPTEAALDAFVEALAPLQVVANHARGPRMEDVRGRYDDQLVWATDRGGEHVLFRDDEWVGPPWLGDQIVRQIKTRYWKRSGGPAPPAPEFPDVGFGSVEPAAEGVDLDRLRERFAGSSTDPYGVGPAGDGAAGTAQAEADGGDAAATASAAGDPSAASDADGSTTLDAEAPSAGSDAATDATGDARVPARVLRGGDTVLLELLPEADRSPTDLVDLAAGDVVDVRIDARSDGAQSTPCDGGEDGGKERGDDPGS